jgi:hypothetical protein
MLREGCLVALAFLVLNQQQCLVSCGKQHGIDSEGGAIRNEKCNKYSFLVL